MVGEFPELQGVMGRYYALNDGEPAAVGDAIADHYKPLGPGDSCPIGADSIVVALADKIDTLAAFFGIGEPPTGSRDPYALRRAALGMIRMVLENELRLPLRQFIAADVLDFIADRLKVHLREQGVSHDLIAAAFAQPDGSEDDLTRLVRRVDALRAFVALSDGANLLTAYRRASNIVGIEERKDGVKYEPAVNGDMLELHPEQDLNRHLTQSAEMVREALNAEDFDGAMAALASLRPTVDEFFGRVTVNVENKRLRENRLRLLSRIRATMNQVADFSQIEG